MCPKTLLPVTRYLENYLVDFGQTYNNYAQWGRDERDTFWGQKVKVQGHGGIKYAGNSTFEDC